MTVMNLHNLKSNNPNLDLVNINAYAKNCQIPSINPQDIELKWNSDLRVKGHNFYKFTQIDV